MLLATILVALLLVIVGSISYAYFSAQTEEERQEAELSMATLSLRFVDNDNGINAEMKFGETVTKKFLIENTGTAEASLSIDWYNLINTYLDGSLTYSLSYSDSENGEYTVIRPKSNVPVSSKMVHQTLEGEISVPADETYYYNLKITLNDLPAKDQSSDLNAKFSTMFNVGQPIKYRYYRLQVNPNGGIWNGHSSTQEYLLKNNDTLQLEIPTRVGHTFDGWQMIGISSDIIDDTFTMGIGDAVLIANWTPNKYTLTIDTNGGDYFAETSLEMNYGSSINLGTPTREGYTFTGWTTSAGTLEDNVFTMSEARDVTLTANWQINNYKYIVYHHQMNTDGVNYTLVGADTDEGEAQFNSTVTPGVKTYTGFTSPTTQSLTIKEETTYPPVLNKIDYNYARNKYTLTIDPAGGTYGGSTSVEMFYGSTTTLSLPVRTGYNFSNWTTTSGTINGNNFTMGISNATITASYTPKTFSVTFNANGGTTSTASKTVTYGSTYGDLPIPTYSGYNFLGWYTTGSGGNQITSSTKVVLSDDQTLFAHWKKKDPVADTLAKLNIISKGTVSNFDAAAITEADSGVYQMADDYGTSYYYRGVISNNYVKFAGFYWRIIRVNGNGSLRIIYDGTSAHANGESSADRFISTDKIYNIHYNDAKYVGWMYGPSGTTASTSKAEAQTNAASSNLKGTVDSWYITNIANKGYGSAVSDTLFCNDRSTPGQSLTGWSDDTGLGYGSAYTAFGATARSRVWNSIAAQAQFKCPQKNDAFTVNDTTKGNGALTYPVGLITADEIMAAGSGKYGTANQSYYLYKGLNHRYWSFSPCFLNYNDFMFVVDSYGAFNSWTGSSTGDVAPVINLSAEYVSEMIGTGISTDPYRASDVSA